MINFFNNLLALPDFEDDLQSYSARMLRMVLAFIAVIAILYAVINIANDPGNSLRYILQFAFILATIATMAYLLRKGRPQAASLVLIFSAWAIFTAAAYTGGGLRSSAYIGYLVVLAIAGLVAAHPAWTLIVAALCAISGYGLLYAEQKGFLPTARAPFDSQSVWLDSLIYMALVTFMQIMASRIVLSALRQSRQESQQKQEAKEREKKRGELLKKVIELGKEVTQANELDWCLKKIHQSVQKGLGFDRVGIFLYDENQRTIHGAYGTDKQGNLEDTSWFIQNADEYEAWKIALSAPDGIHLIENYSEVHKDLPLESEMAGVKQHITLAAWSGKQPVALLAVDNAITNEPISEENFEALRLFAGYAGLAITNARNLEAVNRELESFSYSVSHDLRSPLRAVVGFSKILLTDFNESVPEDGLRYIQKIQENGKKMGLLIDDLLSFSRVGRQTLRITQFEIKSLVETIVKTLQESHPERNVNWKIGDLPACRADFTLLQLALTNLLENAITYTHTKATTEIEIGSIVHDNQIIYFVRDNGIGFEMQYADKIFRIFHRLHYENEFEGTGVGLAIVQRIMQRHGGRIWAESEPDKGATFFFSLT